MGSAFARLKSRYLLLWLVLSGLFGALVASPPTLPASSPEPLQLGVLTWVMYAALMLLTGLQAWWAGLHPGHILGARVSGTSLARMSVLAIPLVGVAMACTYGVFAPLSLIWPGAVHFLLIEDMPVFYDAGPPYSLLANLAGVTAVTIAAPFAEEWLFRGLLLRRWSAKWGITSGVVGSSLVFAILHADIVGAFLFGVAMCALYERYGSLWPPIAVHAANNVLVTLLAVAGEHTGLFEEPATVEQFRSDWWMLIAGLLLLVPWLGWLRRVWKPIADWRFESAAEHAIMQPPR
jgi:membrane protease YdiL (CAAX protease family)